MNVYTPMRKVLISNRLGVNNLLDKNSKKQ